MTAVARPAPPKLFRGSRGAVVIAGNAAGAACILANWWQAADSSDLKANLSSAGLGIVGVVIAGLTNALWLQTARGAIAGRRRYLSSRVGAWAAPLERAAGVAAVPGAAPARPPAAGPGLMAVDGATLYHRPDCPLVSRKQTAVAAVETHEANGLRPCGVCEPALSVGQDGARQ
ncbi:MAG TPA: hypothetical protein VHL53_23250 [Acidimicrobiia bacterium]|nr:hypothetical protein [Acidimicrobiia bacterium]